MFEIYNYINKIPEYRYLKMHEILKDDYINRNGIDKYNKSDFEGNSFNKWVSMIRNDKNYNIILYIIDNNIVGFITYMFIEDKLCISEVQIIKEYQGKYGILKKLIKKVLSLIDKDIKEVVLTINDNNTKSKEVFTHIGFSNIKSNWYKIDIDKLLLWINK